MDQYSAFCPGYNKLCLLCQYLCALRCQPSVACVCDDGDYSGSSPGDERFDLLASGSGSAFVSCTASSSHDCLLRVPEGGYRLGAHCGTYGSESCLRSPVSAHGCRTVCCLTAYLPHKNKTPVQIWGYAPIRTGVYFCGYRRSRRIGLRIG